MDPNANLAEILQIIRAAGLEADHNRLAELIEALDEWIVNGGFLPERWCKK